MNNEERIAYMQGIVEGITMYAVWKNGEQVVGIMETPLWKVTQPYTVKIDAPLNAIA